MSWLAPVWLWMAGAAALGVIALHLLARRRPASRIFPTARFIPATAPRATTRTLRPTDLLLMALRLAIVLLTGAAFAGPVLARAKRERAVVVIADRSRAVGSAAAIRDSVARIPGDADVLVVFDSTASVVAGSGGERIDSLARVDARGSLSAALIVAIREARALRERAEEVDIVLVSPLAAEEWDAATEQIRVLWPGAIRLVRTAPRLPLPPFTVDSRLPASDPVGALAALSAAPAGDGYREARLRRGSAAAGDSAAAAAGALVIEWPRIPGGDTTPAVVYYAAGPETAIGPFRRRSAAANGTPIIWTIEGEAVAWERAVGSGCIRHVGVDFPEQGDVPLRADARALMRQLTRPCGLPSWEPPADTVLARFAASASTAGDSPPRLPPDAPWRPWLFAAAAALAMIEPLARRQRSDDGR